MMSVTAGLVSDINQLDSNPTNLTASGGKLFYLTHDSSHGTESLWATDGTAQGSVDLGTIDQTSYAPAAFSQPIISSGGSVYFMGPGSSGNQDLYKSDGTVAGTVLVAPITGGVGKFEAAAGGKVYFTEGSPNGGALWASDGTTSGTTELSSSGSWNIVGAFAVRENSVYFTAEGPGAAKPQLWTSDGTPSGTVPLTNLPEGLSSTSITTLGGNIVFVGHDGDDGTDGDQLWATDGTSAGTMALTHFSGATIGPIQSANGAVYFVTYDSTTNTGQVWTSDGTASGTMPVATTGGSYNDAGDFTAVGNTVYFVGGIVSPTDAGAARNSGRSTAESLPR